MRHVLLAAMISLTLSQEQLDRMCIPLCNNSIFVNPLGKWQLLVPCERLVCPRAICMRE